MVEVVDDFCPWNAGRWEIEGGPDGAGCVRSDKAADITMSANDLGAVYLGGTRLAALAQAGRIDGSPDAVRRADVFFLGDAAPFCQTFF